MRTRWSWSRLDEPEQWVRCEVRLNRLEAAAWRRYCADDPDGWEDGEPYVYLPFWTMAYVRAGNMVVIEQTVEQDPNRPECPWWPHENAREARASADAMVSDELRAFLKMLAEAKAEAMANKTRKVAMGTRTATAR